ncbi:MAG: DNA-binding protein WhiA [Clostridia bacterium]|nr:DNA-binding protein WhiA [Clostridia bacterium]
MNYFEIPVKNTCRKAKFMVYLKKAESISNMLTLLGAGSTVLTYENVRIKKEVSNQVNRQINCDQSNINRVVSASETQIQDILYIDSELGLNKLPKSLRDIAEVRLGNPATSLTGLGELFDPPLGKSCVNARLRKLTDIAQKLRSGEEVRL